MTAFRRLRAIIPSATPLAAPASRSCGAFDYAVRFQRRKTISLHVLSDGSFELRAPVGYKVAWIDEFVAARVEWALAARARQLQRQQWRQPPAPGAQSWLLGQPLHVQIVAGSRFSARVAGDVLHLTTKDPGDLAAVDRQIQGWYRRQAQRIFSARLAACCARFPRPVEVPPLALRRMRRRWGSCSRQGKVTLNVDLVRLAPELIDYVVMHELCHLFEFNHGPAFYRLQAEAVPDWRELEQRLKQF